ncbi:DUF7347 domain-containing protein [Thermofilum pendens]|uniref:DUF7347 domain-containing protein n=1 Tax=Thermofilum pendens (strain DSM 2475 / Hrk 5) TaxID=368408 RepID=A1RY91_THEPD|nr:transcriptional regulator [Thermofilum pendens]ABL78171.1 hypothetical protein Tpen_0769 [Thermofilum pendens Hrk 5]
MRGDVSTDALEYEKVYEILGNPLKRSILRILGERGEASFTELKSSLKTSTGNLYYNLDGMEGFVTKNEKRRYTLTEKGIRLYRFMLEEDARLRNIVAEKRGFAALVEKYFLPVIVPESLAAAFYHERSLSLVILGASLLLGALPSALGAQVVFMMDQLALPYRLIPLGFFFFVLGALVLLLVVELVQRVLGGHGGYSVDYLGAFFASLLPVYAFNVLQAALPWDPFTLSLLYRLVQVPTLGLLTATLAVYKRLPRDRAFIASFVAYYSSYMASMMLQRIL